jgi:hypothetical protein
MRYFASYIYKESNVYDRKIEEYLQGVDLLMESEKIKNEIFSKNQHFVYNSIVKIIENTGYPDENLIGLSGRDSQNSSKDRRIFYFSEQNFNNSMLNNSIVLDIFSSSFPAEESDISSIIMQAVRNGKLLPHHINRLNASRGNFSTEELAAPEARLTSDIFKRVKNNIEI